MLTKAGGSVLVAHGADTFTSGMRDVWTGESHKTLTQQAGEQLAYSAGANQAQAERTGIVLDVAVPLLVAATTTALRIVSVRAGRVVLAEHEALGGHTLLKHVGKTEGKLRARLVLEPSIPAAGSFPSLRVAEAVISDALKRKLSTFAPGPPVPASGIICFPTMQAEISAMTSCAVPTSSFLCKAFAWFSAQPSSMANCTSY